MYLTDGRPRWRRMCGLLGREEGRDSIEPCFQVRIVNFLENRTGDLHINGRMQ